MIRVKLTARRGAGYEYFCRAVTSAVLVLMHGNRGGAAEGGRGQWMVSRDLAWAVYEYVVRYLTLLECHQCSILLSLRTVVFECSRAPDVGHSKPES